MEGVDAFGQTATSTGANGSGMHSRALQTVVTAQELTEIPATAEERRVPFSTVPYGKDPDFVDRGDILNRLLDVCSQPSARAALVGPGGVGKSHLAIQLSHVLREKSPETFVFWVRASSASRFNESYRAIASKLGLPGLDAPSTDVLRLVQNWLCDQENGTWVMLVDNSDDTSAFDHSLYVDGDPGRYAATSHPLETYLPQTYNGRVVFTTRSKEAAIRLTGSHENIINVGPMDDEEAKALCLKKLNDRCDEASVLELVRTLDHVPLAITQASAYINNLDCQDRISLYLQEFRDSEIFRSDKLQKDVSAIRRDEGTKYSVFTAWHTSFPRIRKIRSSAVETLILMSFFNRQGIPDFLLRSCMVKDPDRDVDADTGFKDDIALLISYNLISRNASIDAYEMHGLIQSATRQWLDLVNNTEKWRPIFLWALNIEFPSQEYNEDWSKCRVLLPQVETAAAERPALSETDAIDYWSSVLHVAARFCRTVGRYDDGEPMARAALEVRSQTLGSEHEHTLSSMSVLSVILAKLGKDEEAEKITQLETEARKKVGRRNPGTAGSLNNLAIILKDLGKYEKAEDVSRQAFEISEEVLGEDHMNTLKSMTNLCSVLQQQGKHEEAEKIGQLMVERSEKSLGEDHALTLLGTCNLGLAQSEQGKHVAAEATTRRALEGMVRVLGEDHPDTLICMSNLGLVLGYLGNFEEAEDIHRHVLARKENVHGADHRSTIISMSMVASALRDLGEIEEAADMHRRTLDRQRKALGEDHRDIFSTLFNLAEVYHNLCRYDQAVAMMRDALSKQIRTYGHEHPVTDLCKASLDIYLASQASALQNNAQDG